MFDSIFVYKDNFLIRVLFLSLLCVSCCVNCVNITSEVISFSNYVDNSTSNINLKILETALQKNISIIRKDKPWSKTEKIIPLNSKNFVFLYIFFSLH